MDPLTPEPHNVRPTRRKGQALRDAPSPSVLIRLQSLVERSRRSSVPFPVDFVRDTATEDGPPLARILRGGRGGEVRLKVLLSMHLLGVKAPHHVPGPSATWATMLDLPEPLTNGARRVRDATEWLVKNQFIRLEKARGKEVECVLLSPLGTGDGYSRPSPANRYIRVPTALWQNGWIVALTGTALAMWMVLAELQGGKEDKDVWVQPAEARERYDLSEDTFTKGISQLERHGLVRVTKQPQGAEDWHYNRLRNAYHLYGGRFHDLPGSDMTEASRQPLPTAIRPRKRR